MNRRKERMKTHDGTPLKFVWEMCMQRDKQKPQDNLFWSRIGSKEPCQGGREWHQVDGWGGGKRLEHLTNPAAELLKLVFKKKILVVLGEELVDPRMETHHVHPKFTLGLDKDLCDAEAGLFAVDACIVRFAMSIRDHTVESVDLSIV